MAVLNPAPWNGHHAGHPVDPTDGNPEKHRLASTFNVRNGLPLPAYSRSREDARREAEVKAELYRIRRTLAKRHGLTYSAARALVARTEKLHTASP